MERKEGIGRIHRNVHITWSVHEVDRKALHPHTDSASSSWNRVDLVLRSSEWGREKERRVEGGGGGGG